MNLLSSVTKIEKCLVAPVDQLQRLEKTAEYQLKLSVLCNDSGHSYTDVKPLLCYWTQISEGLLMLSEAFVTEMAAFFFFF